MSTNETSSEHSTVNQYTELSKLKEEKKSIQKGLLKAVVTI